MVRIFVGRMAAAAFLLFLGLSPTVAWATSTGKTGVTATGCTCHSSASPSGVVPQVRIEGPERVMPGATVLLQLLITHQDSKQTHGGLDVSVTEGSLSTQAGDTSTKVQNGEITHTAPLAEVGGVTTFNFRWTAPSSFSSVIVKGAGNSVNKDGAKTGDNFSLASYVIDVCPDEDGDGARDADCGGTDCNDASGSIYPGAADICGDGIAQDCVADKACPHDDDKDGQTLEGGDCDDQDPSIYVGAEEEPYDGIDQDCDGKDLTDLDEDGFDAVEAGGDDCRDDSPDINPLAKEVCGDGIDQDCSGVADDLDEDLDGSVSPTCDGPDCDDSDPITYPGAPEKIDGKDNNCDGNKDEGTDGDGDSYTVPGDCNDGDPAINPGAEDSCEDGIDQDCSGDDALCPTPTATPSPTPTEVPATDTPEATPTGTPEADPTEAPAETTAPAATDSPTSPPSDDDAGSCSCKQARPSGTATGAGLMLLAGLGLGLRRRRSSLSPRH